MSKPLLNALEKYAAKDTARFHMPGHKGIMPGLFSEMAKIDFTELDGTGNLYTEKNGAIRRSEALMAGAFGAAGCLYLTNGATQGIFTMMAQVTKPGDTVIVDRACHKSVYHAMALLDLHPVYLRREVVMPFGIEDAITADALPDGKCVLVTTPSYYGVVTDTSPLRALCAQKGIPLLLDSAHGAHTLKFDADMAVYSAHKTLDALGQAAFLLVGANVDIERTRYLTSVFGTSSPSYPVMASLDYAQSVLNSENKWAGVYAFGEYLREKFSQILSAKHLPRGSCDLSRICFYTGGGYASALKFEREFGVVCEMADENNIVFILTGSDSEDSLKRLEEALESSKAEICESVESVAPQELPLQKLSPREAFYAPRELVRLDKSAGRIAASALAPYPPGSPLVAMGEKIDEKYLEILFNMCYNRHDLIEVIK